jgi:HK97 family phage prohead protease
MPYYITDEAADCSGWAVVDQGGEVFGCHETKDSAIKQAVAISLGDDEPFMGERNETGEPIVISDLDDTLIRGRSLIRKTYDYLQTLDGALFIVTGRPIADEAETVQTLEDLGVRYTRLIMNPGSLAESTDYKRATAESLLEIYNVLEAVENNPDTLRAYRSLGIKATDPADLPEENSVRAINQEAPAYMRAAARQGLRYYEQGLAGDGVVDRTISEARLMADGEVSDDKWVRIAAWIARHLVDLDSPDADPNSDNYPSAGVVAHLLWGSGPSRRAAERAKDYADSVVARIREEEESERMTEENRALPGELNVGDYVAWLIGTEAYAGEVMTVGEESAEVTIYEEENDKWVSTGLTILVPIATLNKVDPLVEAEELPELTESTIIPTRTKWLNAAYAIKARIEGVSDEGRAKNPNETRIADVTFELRESTDGMTFEGYAAVFNSDSSPLPFIERIAPGAFARSLKSRNDIKLLWNHDTGIVLGSTRAGTLRLMEDSFGLKAVASLPDTQAGRDAAVLLKRGDVSAMSFGFTVPQGGDSWDKTGNVRTLNRVSLHEVSLVAFPAYSSTTGTTSVRSLEGGIDADTLADALLKLELGEELEADQAILVTEVVGKLTKTPEVQEVEGDILALKKKKLDLLMLGI